MTRRTEAHINLAACEKNLRRVREIAPNSRVMGMVKSNGYGHGLAPVASALDRVGVDQLGVAIVDEGLAVREAGVGRSIIVMEGFFDTEELETILDAEFYTVIHHQFQLDILAKTRLRKTLRVWLKIDTGMNRLGFQAHEAVLALEALTNNPYIEVAGVMTHFANADDREDPLTAKQIARFDEGVKKLALPQSMANSAGIMQWPESHRSWVRPGLMLYGASPVSGTVGDAFQLEPAMTLRSQLVSIKSLKAGDSVSYGTEWTAPRDTVIGVIAMGYGDGYPGNAKSGTPVLVNGRRAYTVGRVCMDLTVIDLGPDAKDNIGDRVVLWGEGLPVEEVAASIGVVPQDLFCGVTRRVKFFVQSHPHAGKA